MNKFIVIISAFLMFSLGCKEDGTNPGGSSSNGFTDATKAKMYNKVWYATASGGGIDLEFLSDGTFRQAKSLEGSYIWQNGGDTMNIQDYQGKRFNFVFDEITSSQITFRSNMGGDTYKTSSIYRDTK